MVDSLEAKPNPLDDNMKVAIAGVATAGFLMAVIAAVGWGARAGLGVCVGAAVATVNLWGFALIVKGVLGGGPYARLWSLAGFAKLILLFAVAYFVMDRGWTSGLTMAIGYASMPFGITLATLLVPRHPEDRAE